VTIADIPDQKASHATVSKLIESLIEVEKNCLQLTLLSKEYQRVGTKRYRQVLLNSDGASEEARSYASIYLYSKTESEGKAA